MCALLAAGALPAAAQAKGFNETDRLSLNGLGDVKLGMSEQEFKDVSDIFVVRSNVGACTFYDAGDPRRSFSGPRFRFQDGKLVVIEVGRGRGYRTVQNVGYRSKLSTLRRKYKGIKTTRSLGGGKYLRWKNQAGDRGYAFNVPTHRAQIRAVGLLPYLDQQECS